MTWLDKEYGLAVKVVSVDKCDEMKSGWLVWLVPEDGAGYPVTLKDFASGRFEPKEDK